MVLNIFENCDQIDLAAEWCSGVKILKVRLNGFHGCQDTEKLYKIYEKLLVACLLAGIQYKSLL